VNVAILQNQVGVDGRSRVIGEIVVALNELGVTPDVYTLSPLSQQRHWREVLMEGRALQCELPRQVRLPFLRGYAYQTVAHNWLLRNTLRRYDWVVNSNDFVGFLPRGVRRLHYFHFPVRASFGVMSRYRRDALRAIASPARWLANRFDGDLRRDDIVLANSCFTRQQVRELWPRATVEVLYPPVDAPPPPVRDRERDIDVVTLGNIAPDKRQLEQVEIAATMPRLRFAIVGAIQSRAYARRVERAVRATASANVTLIFDAGARAVSDYLGRARVLLHMKEFEHFGIGIAQAIGHGCIPIVHDSGGQVELVTNPLLRFRSTTEIPQILDAVLDGRLPGPGYVDELRERVRGLAPESFRSRIKDALT